MTIAATAAQIHIVPGSTIFGGTYRFMALAPIVNANVSTPFGSANETGLGDITISPLNLSWMLSPGIFVQTGLSFGLPTGKFDSAPGSVQLGTNAFTTAVDVGFSYLRMAGTCRRTRTTSSIRKIRTQTTAPATNSS